MHTHIIPYQQSIEAEAFSVPSPSLAVLARRRAAEGTRRRGGGRGGPLDTRIRCRTDGRWRQEAGRGGAALGGIVL